MKWIQIENVMYFIPDRALGLLITQLAGSNSSESAVILAQNSELIVNCHTGEVIKSRGGCD